MIDVEIYVEGAPEDNYRFSGLNYQSTAREWSKGNF